MVLFYFRVTLGLQYKVNPNQKTIDIIEQVDCMNCICGSYVSILALMKVCYFPDNLGSIFGSESARRAATRKSKLWAGESFGRVSIATSLTWLGRRRLPAGRPVPDLLPARGHQRGPSG